MKSKRRLLGTVYESLFNRKTIEYIKGKYLVIAARNYCLKRGGGDVLFHCKSSSWKLPQRRQKIHLESLYKKSTIFCFFHFLSLSLLRHKRSRSSLFHQNTWHMNSLRYKKDLKQVSCFCTWPVFYEYRKVKGWESQLKPKIWLYINIIESLRIKLEA